MNLDEMIHQYIDTEEIQQLITWILMKYNTNRMDLDEMQHLIVFVWMLMKYNF